MTKSDNSSSNNLNKDERSLDEIFEQMASILKNVRSIPDGSPTAPPASKDRKTKYKPN